MAVAVAEGDSVAGRRGAGDVNTRVAELRDAHTRLSQANPGFDYLGHAEGMSGYGAVRKGLTTSDTAELESLLSDDYTFFVWTLRFQHPNWRIGTRAREVPLTRVASIARGAAPSAFTGTYCVNGHVGAHWETQAVSALRPLSQRTRRVVADELRKEAMAREVTGQMSEVLPSLGMGAYIDQFAKDVREATETVTNLSPAMDTLAEILGQEWETSLHDMLTDIDAVWHGGIEKALALELQERGTQ